MMIDECILSPTAFLTAHRPDLPHPDLLKTYESFWRERGQLVSDAVDRMGTPWLRMFDEQGRRVDEVCYPPDYWTMLREGYRAGVIWRCFQEESLLPFFLLGYVTCFFDPGLYCPHTVSMSTAVPLYKYGAEAVKARFLPPLVAQDDSVWQGATWMTESGGGSDLGRGVETVARLHGDGWLLDGDKYFASNAHADLAVVAARPDGAPAGVRGLALYLVPRRRADGSLNFTIRRIKDKIGTRSVPTGEVELRGSKGYLLGTPEMGIYLILETLNISRIANSVGSAALAQRAIADAYTFARERIAFDRPIADHPLLARQFDERISGLRRAFALAWEAVDLLNSVWKETPRYSDRYHLFRLAAHLAKFWTAEFAAQTAKWAMEVYAGVGTLQENRVERWLREAMILAIWEGTPHRQMLDGLEVIERNNAHRLLIDHLGDRADPQAAESIMERIDDLLALPQDEKEAGIEPVFRELAEFTAGALAFHRQS